MDKMITQNKELTLEVKDLSFTYNPDFNYKSPVLFGISFKLFPGDFLGVVGNSGSGKSTLVRIMSGLLKATSGAVLVKGMEITRFLKKDKSNRFKISATFQSPEDQLFLETVYKDVAFGPCNMGLKNEEIKECVTNAINFVGLDKNFLDQGIFELSGGEKRKVAIAGIISMNPEILILDEPTAGLDCNSSQIILSNMKKYCKTRGSIFVLVSHNLKEIAKYTNKALVLRNGKQVFFGNTSELLKLSTLERLKLPLPDPADILVQLKKIGYNVEVNDIFSTKEASEKVYELLGHNDGKNVKLL